MFITNETTTSLFLNVLLTSRMTKRKRQLWMTIMCLIFWSNLFFSD